VDEVWRTERFRGGDGPHPHHLREINLEVILIEITVVTYNGLQVDRQTSSDQLM